MGSRPNMQEDRYRFSPTVSGPRPCDFPVGSVQSRAAARAVVLAHVEQERKELEAEFGKDVPQIRFMMEGLSALARDFFIQLLRVAQVRAKVFQQDFTLPTIEEIRRNRARLENSLR
jgi:hypothetical protein